VPNNHLCPITTSFYGNYACVDTAGNILFRCDDRKRNWYLKRNLIKIDPANPSNFSFLFIPKGPGHLGDPFFLQDRKNQCVVCGEIDGLTRHHVVPHCYRRFYPNSYNRVGSYDVLMLCGNDHFKYERFSDQLKAQIAEEFEAPIHGIPKNATAKIEKADFLHAKGAANALKNHGNKIPEPRKEILLKKIKHFLKKDEILPEDITSIINTSIENIKFEVTTHGEIVLSKLKDLNSFNIRWRNHFYDSMQPKYLPEYWEIKREFSL